MFKKEDICTLSKEQIEEKAQSLLSQLTLKEKVWMLNGNWDSIWNMIRYKNSYNPVPIKTNGAPRLGVSPIAFTDGPRGVVMGNSTCFPSDSKSTTCPAIIPAAPAALDISPMASMATRGLTSLPGPSVLIKRNASVNKASPANMAVASPNTLWVVGFPLR